MLRASPAPAKVEGAGGRRARGGRRSKGCGPSRLPGHLSKASPLSRGHCSQRAPVEIWDVSRREEQGWWARWCIPLFSSPAYILASQSSFQALPQPKGPSPQKAPAQGCPKRRVKTLHYLCSWQPHTAWHTLGAQSVCTDSGIKFILTEHLLFARQCWAHSGALREPTLSENRDIRKCQDSITKHSLRGREPEGQGKLKRRWCL